MVTQSGGQRINFPSVCFLLPFFILLHSISTLRLQAIKKGNQSALRCANHSAIKSRLPRAQPEMSEFHTDALRPSSLPTASLGRRLPTSTTGANKDADAELDKVAEEWNLRIDKEMKNLTGGLGELVELADVRYSFSSSSSPRIPFSSNSSHHVPPL